MNKQQINRMNGVLYGVAIGDALGAPLEFMSASAIKQRHGTVTEMIGGGWLDVAPGEVTDDTQMTLCVAEGIISNPQDPYVEIGRRFIEWYDTQPKDIGNTCAMSIMYAQHLANGSTPSTEDWFNAAHETHIATGGKSAGNGTLMRTAYPAIFYRDISKAMRIANGISKMTHFDPLAATACRVYTEMLYWLIDEPDISIRRDYLTTAARDARYIYAIEPDYIPNPSGFVADTFATALHCVLTTHNFEDALVKAVNLGGDADTIGAITGGLAGALYGFDAIPNRWIATLDDATKREIDKLNRIAQKRFDNSPQK